MTASCVRELSLHEEFSEEDGIALNFTCTDMATRSVDGVGYEDMIRQIDYFIFPCGADGTVADDAEYVYTKSLIPNDDGLAGTYRDTIQTGVLNKIFADGSKTAMVFAVANYVDEFGSNPSLANVNTTIPETVKTWKGLHELEVGATFFEDGGEGFELRWPRKMDPNSPDLFFVMTGEKKIELNPSGRFAVQAEVPLKRLASKATISFTFEEFLEQKVDGEGQIYEEIKWTPMNNGEKTRVYMSNAIEHTTLGGPLSRPLVADSWSTCTKPQEHGDVSGNGTRDLFEYAYDYLKDITDESGNVLAHYYTYPISFDEGDDNQPYLKLVLPWQGYKNFGTSDSPDWREYKQKEVYYKIVLPRGSISEPNMIYQFSVTVNTVGSDNEVKVIGEEYVVKDWSYEGDFSSDVGLGRYISLDIPKDEYDMYDNKVQILFVSSGEVEITKLQIYTENLRGSSPVHNYFINGGPTSYTGGHNANTPDAANPANPLSRWVTVQGSQLVVNHTMNTNINSTAVDIAPYTFVVTLHLTGETSTRFDRTVTITQYPPIFASISSTSNRSTVFLNNQVHTNNQVVVLNHTGGHSLGTIGQNGMTTAANKTIVSVSTLANLNTGKYEDQNVGVPVIGDPTKTLAEGYPVNPQDATQVWAVNDLVDLGNGNAVINEEYRYADPSKSNVIAPKFMLSSGYGSCANNNEKQNWIYNVERCAAYQEDGYPAGRWRLPTEAEILFVYSLGAPANQGGIALIDNPFYGDSHYFANSGRKCYHGGFVNTDSDPSNAPAGAGSSRCVYDLWYWGDDPVSTGTDAQVWSKFQTSK